jgi:Coenzyme PQQ synthesis protein D (PqqD)
MQRYSINAQKVTWELTDGEAVIVHFESSAYYGLNATGTYIWCRLADGALDTGELAERLAARYGKRPADIAADIDGFLGSLKTEELISESATPGAASARPGENSIDDGYEPPRLTKFGELEKLILSGE